MNVCRVSVIHVVVVGLGKSFSDRDMVVAIGSPE